MPVIDINLDGDSAWPDLRDRPHEVLHLPDATWKIAALEGGMTSGKPSIALRLDLPSNTAGNGATVMVTETSLASWIAATCALRGRFPDAFAGTPLEVQPDEFK